MRMRMDYLDGAVIRFASSELCTRERLSEMLGALCQHLSVRCEKVSTHLVLAEKDLGEGTERLQRLRRSIEEGLVPLDEILHDRIVEISAKRETAKKHVERLRLQMMPQKTIDDDKIEAFSRVFRERLKDGNPILRRNYLKSVIGAVIVEPDRIRIVGGKNQLADNVRAFYLPLDKFQLSNRSGAPDEMKLGTTMLLYLHYKFDVTLRVIPGNAVINIYLAHDLARALSSADGDSYGNDARGIDVGPTGRSKRNRHGSSHNAAF